MFLFNLPRSLIYYRILAASVIRMFMHVFGEETFKKGLNYYLTNK